MRSRSTSFNFSNILATSLAVDFLQAPTLFFKLSLTWPFLGHVVLLEENLTKRSWHLAVWGRRIAFWKHCETHLLQCKRRGNPQVVLLVWGRLLWPSGSIKKISGVPVYQQDICPDEDRRKIKCFNYNTIQFLLGLNRALNISLRCLNTSSLWPRELTNGTFHAKSQGIYCP